ncbi:MAG: efflux RND transporter permease subunit, partial [Paracoccus sp. (in: a-proteobacteria)]|nr:efflux RND transporter permease subunit [Paracoccus sp. (in: a-proteobacteria)]
VIAPLNVGLGSLNIYTQIGMIALIGIITKHGILLVEFANQQRHELGLSREAGMVQAARLRLRPILMTTIATAVGVVPLMTADGAGAAARFAMGLVIFSGITVGTLFTLFIVPTVYTLISPKVMYPDPEEPDPQARGRSEGRA